MATICEHMFVWSSASIYPASSWWWPPGGSQPLAGAAAGGRAAGRRRAARGGGLGGGRGLAVWTGGWCSGRRSRAAPSWCWCRRPGAGGGGLGGARCGAGVDRRGGRGGRDRGSPTSTLAGCAGSTASEAATIAAARRALGRPARMGAGPTRFCALAAALAVRSRRPLVLEGKEARRWLAGRPVGLLGFREETAALLEPLTRLGVRTLGELARLGRAALADRFGAAGALAHRLARGEDSPLRMRRPEERLQESMEVGDASSGAALERVLGVLVDRLLARPERRGRTLRAVTLSARLRGGRGLARARGLPPGAQRPRAHPAGAVAAPARCCRRPPVCMRFERRALRPAGKRAGRAARPGPRHAARRACARRSPRCARWPGRTRRCGPSAWTPTRACPSGAWCSRRSPSR